MRFLSLAGGLLLLFIIVGCRGSENPKPSSPQPDQAASDAMGVLQKLVNDQNYRAMGFDSVDQVKQAQLGRPLVVFNIGLDQLKSYQTGTNANSLLSKSSETIYPVTVNGQVKSSITIVQKKEGGYQPASFGNAEVIKNLSRYRSSEQAANDFVVRVLALNMYFLGKQVDNRTFLTPIIEDPRLKLRPGEALPAEIVVQQLVPLANAYNGLPM
jgi:hypothetical protein